MKTSFLNNYKIVNVDSEGCVYLSSYSNFFYNEKIKIVEKDYKTYKKQKRKLLKKKENYRIKKFKNTSI